MDALAGKLIAMLIFFIGTLVATLTPVLLRRKATGGRNDGAKSRLMRILDCCNSVAGSYVYICHTFLKTAGWLPVVRANASTWILSAYYLACLYQYQYIAVVCTPVFLSVLLSVTRKTTKFVYPATRPIVFTSLHCTVNSNLVLTH